MTTLRALARRLLRLYVPPTLADFGWLALWVGFSFLAAWICLNWIT